MKTPEEIMAEHFKTDPGARDAATTYAKERRTAIEKCGAELAVLHHRWMEAHEAADKAEGAYTISKEEADAKRTAVDATHYQGMQAAQATRDATINAAWQRSRT